MSFAHPDVLDAPLNEIRDNATHLYICSALPSTFAEATITYALGNKAAPSIGAPGAGSPNGRAIVVSAITDGVTTGNGDASHYALVDDDTDRLLIAEDLGGVQAVVSGAEFTLTAITIRMPIPA